MAKQLTTYKPMLVEVYKVLGRGNVVHHKPTEENALGQSGIHTFVSDILDITGTALNEREALKNLYKYLQGEEVF